MKNDGPNSKNETARKTPKARPSGVPLGSTFQDLFAGGNPVWMKIIGSAIAAPMIVLSVGLKADRRGGPAFPKDPLILTCIAVGCAIAGATIGTALSLKDIVAHRLAEGLPVSNSLKLLFGSGNFSLFAIWLPITSVLLIVGLCLFMP